MLPARANSRFRLADVMPNSLAALRGDTGELGLPAVKHVVVVLVDGLGAAALKARAGHARTLAPRLNRGTTISAGFPTTTASAVASLTTGTDPGQHGMVGYSVLDAAHDRVVNQLSGWDADLDPASWQRMPTAFEIAAAEGIRTAAIGPSRYDGSGFSGAVLRGAEYLGGNTVDDRVGRARAMVDAGGRSLSYLYVPELDTVGHRHGVESEQWTAALETVDGAIARLTGGVRKDVGVLVTADHGMVDVPHESHVIVAPELLSGVRHIAGEPRCLQLHLEAGADTAAVAAAWTDAYGDIAWVVPRDEAVEAGLFGPVAADVAPRIGDVLIGARRRIAFYTRDDEPGRRMVGQHGALSTEEVAVPLIGFGAFGR